MNVEISVGDIFEIRADAIVNPAHPSLLAGSGLCGEIFRKAGKRELESYCLQQLKYLHINQLTLGQVILTPAFGLPFQAIIHTAVPKFYLQGPETLSDCYLNAIKAAQSAELKSIAFPALGIGVNQIPVEISAQALKSAVSQVTTDTHFEIKVVVRDEQTYSVFKKFLL